MTMKGPVIRQYGRKKDTDSSDQQLTEDRGNTNIADATPLTPKSRLKALLADSEEEYEAEPKYSSAGSADYSMSCFKERLAKLKAVSNDNEDDLFNRGKEHDSQIEEEDVNTLPDIITPDDAVDVQDKNQSPDQSPDQSPTQSERGLPNDLKVSETLQDSILVQDQSSSPQESPHSKDHTSLFQDWKSPSPSPAKPSRREHHVVLEKDDQDDNPENRENYGEYSTPNESQVYQSQIRSKAPTKKEREITAKETQRLERSLELAPELHTIQTLSVDSFLNHFHHTNSSASDSNSNNHPSSPLSISSANVTPVTSPLKKEYSPQFKKPALFKDVTFTPRRLASFVNSTGSNTQNSDSEDDLEIVPPTKASHTSKPIRTLAALAKVDLCKGRRATVNPSKVGLFAQLREKQREQAKRDRQERLQFLKDKGVHVLTEEELQNEQEVVNSLLEGERRRAAELAKPEGAGDEDDDDEDYDPLKGDIEESEDEGVALVYTENEMDDDENADGFNSDCEENSEDEDEGLENIAGNNEIESEIEQKIERAISPDSDPMPNIGVIATSTKDDEPQILVDSSLLIQKVRPRRIIETDEDIVVPQTQLTQMRRKLAIALDDDDDDSTQMVGEPRVAETHLYDDTDKEEENIQLRTRLQLSQLIPTPRQRFDKKSSRAKNIVDEEAVESDDEWAGLGGASDDDADADEYHNLEDFVDDDSKIDAKQTGLEAQKLFAENERARDSELVNRLMNDVANGGFRKRRGGAMLDDFYDSDDDQTEYMRERLRREERKRMRLMEEERICKLADNVKAKAFIDSIADVTVAPSFEDGHEETQLEDELDSQNNETQVVSEHGPHPTVFKKPTKASVAAVRETLSFLEEDGTDFVDDTQPVGENVYHMDYEEERFRAENVSVKRSFSSFQSQPQNEDDTGFQIRHSLLAQSFTTSSKQNVTVTTLKEVEISRSLSGQSSTTAKSSVIVRKPTLKNPRSLVAKPNIKAFSGSRARASSLFSQGSWQ